MIKINIKYLLPVLLILIAGGCKDWLEIDPESEVDTDVLFETPAGFQTAMNGIYTNLSASSLYGHELKMFFVEVLGRSYDLGNTLYNDLEDYDYTSSSSIEGIIESIWSDSYNTIANCNSILEQVAEKDSSFFENSGKNMIEGEALSARALLYFDLLRLFAQAPVVADEAEIPYYDELSNLAMPYKQTSEILSLIIDDLKTSKELQRGYDTSDEAISYFSSLRTRFKNTDGFYYNKRRGLRLGYYATTALLAQVALYAGDNSLALENAMEIINNTDLIDLTSSDVVDAGTYDRLLSDGIIFGLYNQDFEDDYEDVSGQTNFTIANTDDIFGSDGDDFRKKCYLEFQGDEALLAKYVITDDDDLEGYITYVIPMFRLSQMYHIAIETMFDSDPDSALELFSTLRTKRGCKTSLPTITLKSDLLTYLINDARREFMGEGQMFYMYKRLNRDILDEEDGDVTLSDEFVIPIPDSEISY